MRSFGRFIVVFAVLTAIAGKSAQAAETEFLRVWPGWRTAESFERIGEYFGGTENSGRRIVLRTHNDVRAGYYFLMRVKHGASLEGARFVVQVIRPDGPEAVQFVFPANATKPGETVFQLGLTGSDWPGGESAHPVAWKVELRGGDGALLTEQKSFLWEKPPK